MIFVFDYGWLYFVGFYGGGGVLSLVDDKVIQMELFVCFVELVEQQGVDVFFFNYVIQDCFLQNLEIFVYRECGDGGDRNSGCNLWNFYVVGMDWFVRYFKIMSLCVEVIVVRNNQYFYY